MPGALHTVAGGLVRGVRASGYSVVLLGSAVVFSLPILLGGGRWRKWVGPHAGRAWARFNLWALAMICGLRYRIAGLEHLGATAGVVVANHQSAWETIALRALLPPQQVWVLKRELTRIPIFGWALNSFAIAIDRSAPRRAMVQLLREGTEALARDYWVIVFPEGTRVALGQRGSFSSGGALLATRTGRAILPVAHNAGHFWTRRAWGKYPGVIDLVIGPPIETAGRRAEDVNQEAVEWIEETLKTLPAPRQRQTQAESPRLQ